MTDSKKNNDFFYQIIIYWNNELKSFVAEVPELKCSAIGATQEAVLTKIKTVVRNKIIDAERDSVKLPKPQGRLALKEENTCIHCKRTSNSSGRWKPVGK